MNIDYELYLTATKKLARTIRIKSVKTADQINSYLIAVYGEDAVDLSNENSWRYYMNAAGLYHPLDAEMSVTSWDTGDVIKFSKENLAIHTKTAKAYAYGTTQYKDLIKAYPTQESLILGILYPCDIDAAILAEDGSVLSYPSELVESNEYNLIEEIESWVKGCNDRWDVPAFSNHHELYIPAQQAIMFAALNGVILNIRLQNCKTYRAHSFHVKQYLMSRGISADIFRYLNKKQSLFLYRNINYILRNVGKREIFTWLVENILTERNLPLASYTIKHSDASHVEDLETTARFKHHKINDIYESSISEYLTTTSMLSAETSLAPGNSDYVGDNTDKIIEKLNTSISNTTQTKILESSVVDTEDTGQLSLENTLLLYWGYLSNKGYYKNLVRVANTITGEYYSLTARNAYTLYLYCYYRSVGITLKSIPAIPFIRVAKIPTPSLDDLLSVVDLSYVNTELIAYARSIQPTISAFVATTDFKAKCEELASAAQQQKKCMAVPEHEYSRGLTEAAISRLYHDELVLPEDYGMTYDQWFVKHSINLDNFTETDFSIMYQAIVTDAVGTDFSAENTLAGLHAAMISLMKLLTSYSVQYIRQFSGTKLIDMKFIMTRLGDYGGSVEEFSNGPVGLINIQSASTEQSESDTLDISPVELKEEIVSKQKETAELKVGLGISWQPPPTEVTPFLRIPSVTMSAPVFTPIE